jgi:hypothetical protein
MEREEKRKQQEAEEARVKQQKLSELSPSNTVRRGVASKRYKARTEFNYLPSLPNNRRGHIQAEA